MAESIDYCSRCPGGNAPFRDREKAYICDDCYDLKNYQASTQEESIAIPVRQIKEMYVAIHDASERLEKGNSQLKICNHYLYGMLNKGLRFENLPEPSPLIKHETGIE